MTVPLQPVVARPLPNTRVPVLPAFADPLLKIKRPLDPDIPLFAERIDT